MFLPSSPKWSIQFKVRVYSVATGNTKLDSFFPTESPQAVQVCLPPTGGSLQFSATSNQIVTTFSPVSNATAFVIKILGP